MGATVRTHLILELLPRLIDLLAALGWQTAAAVALFALLTGGTRTRAPRASREPRTPHRPRPGLALCLATLVLLVLLAS
jgi:hypothetical protein